MNSSQRSIILLFALSAVAFLSSLWFGVDAFSQDSRPCAKDIAKFCKDVQGGRQMTECLKQHESELSPDCKSRVEQQGKRLGKMLMSCESDADKFCKDVQPGGGRIVKCLKEHENDVSQECKTSLDRLKGKK